MTPDEQRLFAERRGQRNLVIGLTLGALAVLFFAITVVRMKV